MRIERTPVGTRLRHGRHLVSLLPAHPGPTHSVFDVLAATVAALASRSDARIAMLGFAAGGTVAPLRKLGCSGRVEAADLSLEAVPAFRRVARAWSGEVTVDRADAAEWLASRSGRFDSIIEDLSVPLPGDVTKPPVSWERLPALMEKRLTRGGVAIVNVLPVPGMSWCLLLSRIAAPFGDARVLFLDEFENRVLVLARTLPPARTLRRSVDEQLESLRSRQAGRVHARTLPRQESLRT